MGESKKEKLCQNCIYLQKQYKHYAIKSSTELEYGLCRRYPPVLEDRTNRIGEGGFRNVDPLVPRVTPSIDYCGEFIPNV